MKTILLLVVLATLSFSSRAFAQLTERRVENLEVRVSKVEERVRMLAGAAFVSGVLAALWAQNSGRNAWLWFFAGVIFLPIALLVLLYKNSNDLKAKRKEA